jgi:spore maturation protein CgeB
MKIVALHPKEWASGYAAKYGSEVHHVSVGGSNPTRLDGRVSFDGIGEVVTREGLISLYNCIEKHKPDVFLFGIHFGLKAPILDRIRSSSKRTKCVLHYTDQRDGIPDYVSELKDCIDLLLITNQDPVEFSKYKKFGIPKVATFYDGVSLNEYWPKPMRPAYDCFFGGHNYAGLVRESPRHEELRSLVASFGGAAFREILMYTVNKHFKLLIRGQYGWDREVFTVKGMKYHPNYLNAMREAKIILSTFNVRRYGLVTRRLFRSVASGRMVLTEYTRGMETLFNNHENIVWYHNISECIDLIRYYLDNDSEREKIGRLGFEKIASEYTYERQLAKFIQIIGESF